MASLSILTPEAVQAWRLAFVAKAGSDGVKARSARISSNSIIRQARSLFAPKVVKFLASLRLPSPLPFAGCEFFPRESMRYISRFDGGEILRAAQRELADTDPDAFLAIFLGLVAGLRRGELDRLRWSDIDLNGGRVIIEDTELGRVKSEDSRGIVDIDMNAVAILRGFHALAAGPFVLEAKLATPGESSRRWGTRYRCVTVFERANKWLRAHGVAGNKALHQLRKQAGSLIASGQGVFAASRFLRHHDIATTSAFYADKLSPTTIDVGQLLQQDAVEANVIELPKANARDSSKGRGTRRR